MSDHHSDSTFHLDDELDVDAVRSIDFSAPLPSDESSYVARLLDSEPRHVPRPDYIHRCRSRARLLTSRQDSINYILQETGWAFQLLLVACLSLAAKMEELYVPLLMELQMFEAAHVFDEELIQRMELLVLAKLDWKLRSVTPFDYLLYFISILSPSAYDSDSVSTIYGLASSLILNTTRVIDFLGFPPSVIATAAVITAAGDGVDLPDTFDARISREMVRSCHRLMDEYLLDECPSKVLSIEPLAPPSPSGVLDAAACASCDSQPENPASVSGSEPEYKRQRSSTPDVQES
ncbi:cyclin-d4-1 [Phtheirospermum japonicum]|uniref:Cyclin-d4-1 n=1 Tax=Phtheirospermum japonicum TaxID=374723 RepID=A0A830BXT4_9LAMI|nr:cyclin-d4-1 [Phtheirospermum japonicum]